MFRVLASSCNDGDCPTFFVDDETGDVHVRGYDLADSTRELDVAIPAAAWTRLISELPR